MTEHQQAAQPLRATLPTTRAARRFADASADVLAELEAQRDALKARFAAARTATVRRIIRAEYQDIRQALVAMRAVRRTFGLTDQGAAPPAPPAITHDGIRRNAALKGRWSRQYDQCRDCGTTELMHAGHGRCWKCYPKWKAAS